MQTNDREERVKALEEAKKRLETRKRERDQAREQKKLGQKSKDYGENTVATTNEIIENLKKTTKGTSDDVVQLLSPLSSVPGKRVVISEVESVNTQVIQKRGKENGLELAQDAEIIKENTKEEEIKKVMKEFMSDKVKPWPPLDAKPKDEEVRNASESKEVADLSFSSNSALLGDGENASSGIKAVPQVIEPLVMSNEAAEALISVAGFQTSFAKKSRWVEGFLEENDVHSIFWELDKDRRGKDKEDQKESLQFKQEYSLSNHSNSSTTNHHHHHHYYNSHSNSNKHAPHENKAVYDMDCCQTNTDLFLVSYGNNVFFNAANNSNNNDDVKSAYPYYIPPSSSSDEPDGEVAVWNYLSPQQPQHWLESESTITVVRFHPSNPSLIFGATVSGQIVGWDVRAKVTPQFRSRIGHNAPVYAMEAAVAMENELQDPSPSSPSSSSSSLLPPLTEEISTTCFSYPFAKESKAIIYGSDEGHLYKIDLEAQSLQNPDLAVDQVIQDAHFGPITNVEFHPPTKKPSRHIDMLFLTSSFDWTVKLWALEKNHMVELTSFRDMQDYVNDVKWSPAHPSVFACGDANGNITLFDLNYDFENPVTAPFLSSPDASIAKLAFAKEGKLLLAGDSKGVVRLYDVNSNFYDPSDEEFRILDDTIQRRIHK
ncbi:hypothetical protein RFI_03606 [Reticulomyxa filosa]|uniref:Uncharacterized protein n=1 Tax=Reticulomyxa filosa TaxID=46433 RepID=X6P5Y2_RETFI|nr:hypothetical protein RFI_03606 [Reticulomyxa filosa]|eukprot:ETO33499.1 hypothetical protein RFI_03606 [Reticulomyxa filosa]